VLEALLFRGHSGTSRTQIKEMNGPDSRFFAARRWVSCGSPQIARSGFDNPQRIGCPASQTLKLLARRSPSVAESPDLIDHIATGSPSFTSTYGIELCTCGGLPFGSRSALSRSWFYASCLCDHESCGLAKLNEKYLDGSSQIF
jgi:hypothetical protein